MDKSHKEVTIVYPINGKNERMGSLFKTSKHLLSVVGKPIILHSIECLKDRFPQSSFIIATNKDYHDQLVAMFENKDYVSVKLIDKTNSQVETLRLITTSLTGSVMFVDCDIVPKTITTFNSKHSTVFTFKNTNKLLNYSNYKANASKTIIDCNEKQKLYKNAGAGIYYFSDVNLFNQHSLNCKSVSECILTLVRRGVKVKLNVDSVIDRYGTLQDIYVDNFSFRQSKNKDLSTGFTTNKVLKYKQIVVKTGNTVRSEGEWYQSYRNKRRVPRIINFTDDTLVMDYVKRDADVQLDDVFELIDEYKVYDKLNNLSFQAYIENIVKHLSNNERILNGEQLIKRLGTLSITPSFCHGDLSIMNIIPTRVGLKLIDPLYSKHKFGSFELDIAKLCFSFKFYKNDSASFSYLKQKANLPHLDILIAAEAVRVATYRKEYSFIAENLINELNFV